jgi:hypothetical protein
MLCKYMGWSYAELLALPLHVYNALIDLVLELHPNERPDRDDTLAWR